MDIASTTIDGFDLVVFIILGFSSLLAFMRGFSRELISVIALVIAVVGSLFVFGRYQLGFQNFIKPAMFADVVLGFSVFGFLYILSSLLMRGWAKSIRGHEPPFLDRVLGLGFGLVRGIVLSSLIVLVFKQTPWMTQAKTYPVLLKVSQALQALPFAKGKIIAKDIQTEGRESDILPNLPQDEQ